ncbi:unnamed protein product [Ilex paraguariensis]|uniref:Dof zinc finger protein n=1 Tax=Ilex paraguariensis TaxID=185542 RepID=A0ABC8RWY5_9AQUA
MDTGQWPQGIGVMKPVEGSRPMVERKPRPQKEQAVNCPRCNSTHTKFCYYNNYSLSQPRYFCKTCRRYWTEGGTLRNVPVGGSSRKNKRSTSSSSPASSKKLADHDLAPPRISQSASQNPKIREGQDLNLAYPPSGDYNSLSEFIGLPYSNNNINPNTSSTSSHLSTMELLKLGITSRGLNSFMPMSVSDSSTIYSSGLGLPEFKPSLNFSLDGFESGFGSLQGVPETSARLLFPFEDLKPVSATTELIEQNREQGESNAYWNGVLGGGSW